MAGEAHPVPFRTRKLSPRAPMVLRRKAVGEQGAADQQGAFSRGGGPVPAPAGAGPPLLARMPAAPPGPPAQDVCVPWRPSRPLHAAGRGAYITSSRRTGRGRDRGPWRGRTLRTGYRDRRDRETDKRTKLRRCDQHHNPEVPYSWIRDESSETGRAGPPSTLESPGRASGPHLNGEFDPGSG